MMKWVEKFYEQEQHQLINWVPIAYIVGVLLFFQHAQEPGCFSFLPFCALNLFFLFYYRRHVLLYMANWAMLACLLGYGVLLAYTTHKELPAEKALRGSFYATVKQVENFGDKLRIEVRRIWHKGNRYKSARVNFRIGKRGLPPDYLSVTPGDRVKFWASLTTPPPAVSPGMYDFQRRAFFKGLDFVGYGSLKTLTILHNYKQIFDFDVIRHHLASRIDKDFGPSTAPIIKSLVVGDKSGLSKELRNQYSLSGLAHILAISGLHMGIITGLVFLLFYKILGAALWWWPQVNGKKLAAVFTLFAGWFYLQLAGSGVPALRSYIMTSLVMLGILVSRSAISMRTLAIAALFILMVYPAEVLYPSFQMSFAAVAGLISVWDALSRSEWYARTVLGERRLYMKFLYYFLGVILTSLIASLATAPFSIMHFHQFSLIGVAANMVAVPLVTFFIMPLVVLYLVFGAPIAPLLTFFITFLNRLAVDFSAMKSFIFMVPQMPMVFFSLILVGGSWLLLWKGRHRYLGMAPILAAFVFSPVPIPHLIIPQEGKNLFMHRNDSSFVVRSNTYASNQWSESYGIKSLQKINCKKKIAIEKTGTYIWCNKKPEKLLEACGSVAIYTSPTLKLYTNADDFGARKWNGYNYNKCQLAKKAWLMAIAPTSKAL